MFSIFFLKYHCVCFCFLHTIMFLFLFPKYHSMTSKPPITGKLWFYFIFWVPLTPPKPTARKSTDGRCQKALASPSLNHCLQSTYISPSLCPTAVPSHGGPIWNIHGSTGNLRLPSSPPPAKQPPPSTPKSWAHEARWHRQTLEDLPPCLQDHPSLLHPSCWPPYLAPPQALQV